jgi:hypothetical protein
MDQRHGTACRAWHGMARSGMASSYQKPESTDGGQEKAAQIVIGMALWGCIASVEASRVAECGHVKAALTCRCSGSEAICWWAVPVAAVGELRPNWPAQLRQGGIRNEGSDKRRRTANSENGATGLARGGRQRGCRGIWRVGVVIWCCWFCMQHGVSMGVGWCSRPAS